MIEPLKPGDDLCPFDVTYVNGKSVGIPKKDWNNSKQIDHDLRTIAFLLQLEDYRGSTAFFRMVDAYEDRVALHGTIDQKRRFYRFRKIRDRYQRPPEPPVYASVH